MKRLHKILLIFLLAVCTLSENVQASCCNAEFAATRFPSTAKNWYRFVMHDSIAADIESVHWSFGDNAFSNAKTPVHAYDSTGDYSVTLTVIKKTVNGVRKTCTETRVVSVVYECSDFIYYNSSLKNFSFYQRSGFLIDSSSNWVRSRKFTWNFGDGQTSNVLNPTHTYAQAGTYTVCLVQSRKNDPHAPTCSVCHTIVVKDTITPVVCNAAFTYALNDSLISLQGNSSIGDSYWWIEGDTNLRAYGNDVRFVLPSEPFTVCHRQYTDSIIGPGSAYCTECMIIRPPVDTITPVVCNAAFIYAFNDSLISLQGNSSIGDSYWWIEGDTNLHAYGNYVRFVRPSETFTVCHRQYTDSIIGPGSAYCTECMIIRPYVDTIPVVCNSDFNYTVTGNTVYAYADSANYFGNLWSISNEIYLTDTLRASYVFTSPGVKRICQSRVIAGSNANYADTCTTCKDVLIETADVTIHPNPAVYQINVQSNDEMISTIHLYDINGSLMKNISGLNVKKYNLDISDLVGGVYYVSTTLADGQINRTKIIIQ